MAQYFNEVGVVELDNKFSLDLAKTVTEWGGTYDADDIRSAATMFNAIAWFCEHDDGYCQGWRNNIAVDLSILSHVLGMDPYEVMKVFIREGLIDPTNDDEPTANRFLTILPYLGYWCNDGNFRDYLTMPSYWLFIGFHKYHWENGDIRVDLY